ncbi:MAG: hypothetical protein Fur005_45600 [Roseiflexaceae bacterium]
MATQSLRVHTPIARQPLTFVTAIILLLEGLLLFVPMAILGQAINWPASLDLPAAEMLPLLQAQLEPTRLGYAVYLIYSILFFPLALLVNRLIAERQAEAGGQSGVLLQIGLGFAALSTLARSIGIIRWLVAMPVLARLYTDPNATAANQAGIAAAFEALNAFGGSIGEVLGVNLFAGVWLLLTSITILRTGALPRWLGIFGLLAAASLFVATIEIFGVNIGALIIVSTSGIQLWFLAAGAVLLRRYATAVRV